MQTQPPKVEGVRITNPAPHVLLVTIDREKQMNSIPFKLHWRMDALFRWFDEQPDLRVAIITGAGKKAFCAGQDLIELNSRDSKKVNSEPWLEWHPPSGFAGISRRVGKKPIVAAVNGFALGGGFEIVLNCDLTIAAPGASFGLPEVLRGLYAGAGGIPRLVRNLGLPLAGEIAMTGRRLSATEAKDLRLINRIACSQEMVVDEAVQLAAQIAAISPDSIIVTRAALREVWESASVERAYQNVDDRFSRKLFEGENVREGLEAFAEKRSPVWKPSKL
ncbi:hypothetical protein AAFC00_000719 [Neodothiora populina]|uniref:Enoyl-CoA hydratase n=1 Tax=Neodothiora populina TaxID=2781224 RepID=A0ABR3PDU7_9PEZI